MKTLKQYLAPVICLAVFETVAVVLWLTKDNIFYLINFSYIGIAIALGIFLFIRKNKYARRIAQLLVGTYMLVYLGLICNENMQIEGFWYYLFTGVFEAATIHYAVAKIFGPLIFGRGWCGQPWCLISFRIKSLLSQERRSAGSGISHLQRRWSLLPLYSWRMLGILSVSCFLLLSSAI